MGHRHGLGLVLLWLCLGAAALIPPLAWKLPYATGAAIKRKRKKKIPQWAGLLGKGQERGLGEK